MAWITPKTDWKAEYDGTGAFVGDYVNIEDYNRIKNNLLFIRDMAEDFFGNIPQITVSADKTYSDYYYADEWNQIEDGLDAIVNATGIWNVGPKQTFYDNGHFITYSELNRIESAELKIYNAINNSLLMRHRLAYRLGTKSSTIKP